ncbi:MAG: hypothetical protein LLG44_01035, partial [Chloroflexi bacterium]|nr:hypothetical protein [Chloroflexota bacterium]
GGAFWYAAIDYPGDGDVITINLTFSPADPVTSQGVGFNVYGPSNGDLYGSGKPTPSNATGIRTMQFASDTAQRLLLQVYNYIDGVQVNFTVTGEGMSSAPLFSEPVLSGSLTGGSGGAFARYTVTFPTSDPATLVMNYSPADSIISRGVNFRIYGPDGQVTIGSGTGTAGQVSATFTPAAGTRYLVQVENYIPGAAVSYSFGSSVELAPLAGGW